MKQADSHPTLAGAVNAREGLRRPSKRYNDSDIKEIDAILKKLEHDIVRRDIKEGEPIDETEEPDLGDSIARREWQ